MAYVPTARPTREPAREVGRKERSWYERWVASLDLPVYQGHYIEDLRTIQLGWWQERECGCAFLEMDGQAGIVELRVTEVPAGATLPPTRMALEEKVYVLDGRGIATVWGAEGLPRVSFEWQRHSLFFIPPNYTYQLSNAQGDRPARVLQSNRLPIAASIINNPDFFFGNPVIDLSILYGEDPHRAYSEARVVHRSDGNELGLRYLWVGNFFPDMKAWDQLEPHRRRGAGGRTVYLSSTFGTSGGHMSVFPTGTYKMAHRHGPGFVLVIPDGEGYSIMWPRGEEPTEEHVCPWHEGSVIVPPNQWFHQHFNTGERPARYLTVGGPVRAFMGTGDAEPLEDRQIAYPGEGPWIRERFEGELARKGLRSMMPPEAYDDRSYAWAYTEDAD